MPSPIKIYKQGTFENVSSGLKISASTKYPVYAYKRDYKNNKGAWNFIPTKAQKNRGLKEMRVSIVRARGIKTTVRKDKGRASQNPNPVPYSYRHTSDWIERGGRVDSVGYPAGKKQPAATPKRTSRVTGQGVKGQKLKTKTVIVKRIKEARKKKDQAAKQNQSAEKAKTPETTKKRAKKAQAKAESAIKEAEKVIKSKKATKSQKDEAKGIKRAAKTTKKSAKKKEKDADKKQGKTKSSGKKKSRRKTYSTKKEAEKSAKSGDSVYKVKDGWRVSRKKSSGKKKSTTSSKRKSTAASKAGL